MLILVPSVTQDVNDQQQIEPAVEHLGALPQAVARPHRLMADNGYLSEKNVEVIDSSPDRTDDRAQTGEPSYSWQSGLTTIRQPYQTDLSEALDEAPFPDAPGASALCPAQTDG
ncbi:MAG: hypothetical protein MZW92_81220 [Comamonadaceae bacterium]|nr:hypothetical protein [Comamonadaceae bacterium]